MKGAIFSDKVKRQQNFINYRLLYLGRDQYLYPLDLKRNYYWSGHLSLLVWVFISGNRIIVSIGLYKTLANNSLELKFLL